MSEQKALEIQEQLFSTRFENRIGIYPAAVSKRMDMDKGKGGRIRVHCQLFTPLHDKGEISPESTLDEEKIKGTEEYPISGTVKVKIGTTFFAEYLGWNDANCSVPDVVPGERILLFRFSGDDTFYWLPYRKDAKLRKHEHLKIACQDKLHNNEPSEDELWYVEVDTRHDRHVRIKTGQGRGETYGYDFTIRPDEHSVTLTDTESNMLHLQTDEERWTLITKSKAKVELIKEDIFIHSPNNTDVLVDNDKTEHVKNNSSETVDVNKTVHVKNNLDETVDINKTTHVKMAETETVDGNKSTNVGGNYIITVSGGIMSITASTGISISTPGVLSLAGSVINLN